MDKQSTQKYSATNYLLYLLSKRDYSEQELHRKLKLKEYSAEEIEQAIETAILPNFYPLSRSTRCGASPIKARIKDERCGRLAD